MCSGSALPLPTIPDRAVRAAGFKKLYAGYALTARSLRLRVDQLWSRRRNRLAQLHHFEDAPAEVYFNSYWSKAEVSNLLEELEQQAGVYQRYQRLRAEHTRARLGVEEVDLWDIAASASGETLPRFTIEQATNIICQAVLPLGAEYGRELAESA